MSEINASEENVSPYDLLLDKLDKDPLASEQKYFLLRQKLIKCIDRKGRGEIDSEELADEALTRTAKKIADGTPVENAEAFAQGVLKMVWLEAIRKIGKFVDPEDVPEPSVMPILPDDPDERMACLRSCLAGESDRDRQMVLRYHDAEGNEKLKDLRRDLAKFLAIEPNYLKQQAFRMRTKLFKCIENCLKSMQIPVTE